MSMDPGIDRPLTYEKDYLTQPGRSWFPLERRHAQCVLADKELPLHSRVKRTAELWLDPNFEPPASFVEEVRAAATHISVGKLNRHSTFTSEDYDFERLEPVLARYAPDLLAYLIRHKMQSMATCPPESRHISAIHATEYLVLTVEDAALASRALQLGSCLKTLGGLRAATKEVGGFARLVRHFFSRVIPEIFRQLFSGGKDRDDNASAANDLLLVEIRHLDAQAQFDALIHADLQFISDNFAESLSMTPASPDTG